jgi:hypothetical protein
MNRSFAELCESLSDGVSTLRLSEDSRSGLSDKEGRICPDFYLQKDPQK